MNSLTPLIDLVRILTASAALLLACLVATMAVKRARDPAAAGEHTHWLTNLSYALCLSIIAVRRLQNLGEDPDVYTWVSLLAVIMGWIGVLLRVRLARVKEVCRGRR